MSDLFREVDEAMRVDRMKRLWEQHGNMVIMAVAAVILGTAFNSGWAAYKTHQAAQQTSALLDAFKSETPEVELDKLSQSLKGTGKAFAALDAGAMTAGEKDFDKSLSYYNDILKDKDIPQDLRDLSVIQKVSIEIDHKPDLSGDDLLAELSPVVSAKNSAWKGRALLLSSIIKAHKKNDYQGALDDLALLSADPSLPAALGAQVRALQDVYGYNLSHTAPKEPEKK